MVEFKGTKSSWGLIAAFSLVISNSSFWQVATGISLHNMNFLLKMGFIITHKFFGIVFSLVVLRLMWKYIFNTHPKYENIPLFHKLVSNLVHFTLWSSYYSYTGYF